MGGDLMPREEKCFLPCTEIKWFVQPAFNLSEDCDELTASMTYYCALHTQQVVPENGYVSPLELLFQKMLPLILLRPMHGPIVCVCTVLNGCVCMFLCAYVAQVWNQIVTPEIMRVSLCFPCLPATVNYGLVLLSLFCTAYLPLQSHSPTPLRVLFIVFLLNSHLGYQKQFDHKP